MRKRVRKKEWKRRKKINKEEEKRLIKKKKPEEIEGETRIRKELKRKDENNS